MGEAFDWMIEELGPRLEQHGSVVRRSVSEQMRAIADTKLDSLPRGQRSTFDFLLSDMNSMRETIDAILDRDLHKDLDQVEEKRCREKLREVSATLDAAPLKDEVGPLYSSIKETTLEIGEMENELLTLERLESQEKSQIVLLNGRIRKQLGKAREKQVMARGTEMIPRIRSVLEDYISKLRAKKISTLEQNILEGITRCFHKKLITGISIDPQSYGVTLYKEDGVELLKEELSKGEMQMYATAIVWGLARTSGRSFPFIIDTPLARLDEQHRENLVRNFYPEASYQAIILSTDTEVVGAYYDLLKPYISHAGKLRYDADKNCSSVDGEYFEKEREDPVAI